MNKPVFGMLLGGVLGIFDGLSALVSAPETAPGIVGIVIGSTIKGVIAGAAIGWFARKVNSLPMGILFGTAVGLLLAWLVTVMNKSAGQPAVLRRNHDSGSDRRLDRRLRNPAAIGSRPPRGVGRHNITRSRDLGQWVVMMRLRDLETLNVNEVRQ